MSEEREDFIELELEPLSEAIPEDSHGGTKTRIRHQVLHSMVDRIQKLRIRRSDGEGAALIEGLDRVVFGTVSAAEAVSLCGVQPPQYLWYVLSGAICDVIQFLIDCTLHFGVGIEDASLCWTLSFTLSIVFRHTTHRYLVFGNYVGGYWNSLLRMYGGYSVSIILSTIFNMFATKLASISHYVAWIITLLWTGVVNYFILKKLWTFGGKNKVGSSEPASTKAEDPEIGRRGH